MIDRLSGLAVAAIVVAGCMVGPTSSTQPAASTAPSAFRSAEPTRSAGPTGEVPTATPTVGPSSTIVPGTSATQSPAPTIEPTPPPSKAPTPSPVQVSPSPAAPTPGTAQSVYVVSGTRTSKQVALTFDFGGRIGDALQIVRYLEGQDVHATVFSTGDQAVLAASNATVRDVFGVVCEAGAPFAVGNHSMTHADFAGLTTARMKAELTDAQSALAAACPAKSPLPLFRPPNGSLGGWRTPTFYRILDAVGSAGYSRTVTWDIDTLDWGAPGSSYYQAADVIVAKVESKVRGGSIVLMHLGGYNTLAAVQVLVPWLRDRGYELVDLHELLGV